MNLALFLVICCSTFVMCLESSHESYYHPNEDPDRLILWKALFTKLNTLSRNVLDISNRQEEQAKQILNLQEATDINANYLKESHMVSKERLDALETKLSKIIEMSDLNTKYLSEFRLESKRRLDDEGIRTVKLTENFNSNSKFLNESLHRQDEQSNQITKLHEAVELTTKFVNETLSQFNKRQDAQAELMKNSCKSNATWTVILRRQDGSVNFYRNWTDYRRGFGNPPNGEFFIGLDRLHAMTTDGPHELVVVLKDWNNEMRYAHYDHFQIGGENEHYALSKLGSYSGDVGDSLVWHKDAKFSTFDQDNDQWNDGNCAEDHKGAWWFKWCYNCHLNGPYWKGHKPGRKSGVTWFHWNSDHYYSLKFAELKLRPKYL